MTFIVTVVLGAYHATKLCVKRTLLKHLYFPYAIFTQRLMGVVTYCNYI